MDATPDKKTSIDGDEFLAVILPYLKEGDAAGLAHAVKIRWHAKQICQLLKIPNVTNVDVRRVAAVTLGLVGNRDAICCLTRALRDPDTQVQQMAEHSLWSIWFRAGSDDATVPFREGLAHLNADNHEQAAASFKQAIKLDPSFAEAYNQCSIAHYLNGKYTLAIEIAKHAVRLMPSHFGAIAGLGHSFAELGELTLALRCYRRAKRINPQTEGLSDAIDRLQTRVSDMNDSGYFELDTIPG